MYLNTIDKIDPKKGEFLLIYDYGTDGLSVANQFKTVEEAIKQVEQGNWAILRLVNAEFQVT